MIFKRISSLFLLIVLSSGISAPVHSAPLSDGDPSGGTGRAPSATAVDPDEDFWRAVEHERVSKRDSILSLITGAAFPENEILITKLGAKGDGTTDCKPAFDKAMALAGKRGGARIVVPEGVYFVKGPIHFVSNVCLDVGENAVILFSSDPDDYLPVVSTSWEATFLYNYSPLIYGYGLHDVSIVGAGRIDGNAAESFFPWRKRQWRDQVLSREMNHGEVPVEERVFGRGHFLRPMMIQFYNCTDITLDGFFITNSPFWCVHLLKTENVICRGLRFDAKLSNNDGIDPEYSKNVLIENVLFDNGDNCVAVKSGRDNDGWAEGIPSENIVIRGCHIGGSGVALGSEMSAGVRNVFVENCTGEGPVGISVKTNVDRGGYIRDLYVKDCDFGEVRTLFHLTTTYAINRPDPASVANSESGQSHLATIENIYVDGLRCSKANEGIYIEGAEGNPARNIFFRDVEIGESAVPVRTEHARNVLMSRCRFNPLDGSED